MSLATAAEVKASREAVQAGTSVTGASDANVDTEVARAERLLYAILGYKIENTAVSLSLDGYTGDRLWLPQRARTVSAATVNGTALATGTWRITGDGFLVERTSTSFIGNADDLWLGGWGYDHQTVALTGTFGYTSSDPEWQLAKEWVIKRTVRELANTGTTGGAPYVPGAYLTSFSSQQAQFNYFTPAGEHSGYADLDRMINLIGVHPRKRRGAITSVRMGG